MVGKGKWAQEYKGRQCLCADNNMHEEGQCQNVATKVGQTFVGELGDDSQPIVVYLCDECFGVHVPVDEYEEAN